MCVCGGGSRRVRARVCCIYLFVYGMYVYQVHVYYILIHADRYIDPSHIFIFWAGASHCTWSSLIHLGSLASEHRGSYCLYVHSTGATGTPSHPAFTWVLGIRTQVLMLVRQVLY